MWKCDCGLTRRHNVCTDLFDPQDPPKCWNHDMCRGVLHCSRIRCGHFCAIFCNPIYPSVWTRIQTRLFTHTNFHSHSPRAHSPLTNAMDSPLPGIMSAEWLAFKLQRLRERDKLVRLYVSTNRSWMLCRVRHELGNILRPK